MTDELPQWDGGPDRMLPAAAITDHLDFLDALVGAGLPEAAGDDIAQASENDALTWLAAGEVAGESRSDRGRVTLSLPFFEDQRIYVEAEQHVEHEQLPPLERWRDTESAIGVLSLGHPSRPIELGIIVGGQVIALAWFEFCRHYDLAPQYVTAVWD